MYIVIAIIAFGILIAVHELGHFLAAKACGVKVLEFSIGMGPKLWQKQGEETAYTLRLLPVGGFCSMEGEDEDSGDPRAFGNQPAWKRLIILIAGAAMNFLLGFIICLLVFAPSEGFASPEITGFYEGCPYESSGGLQAGDSFYSVDGHRTYVSSDVGTYLRRSGGETFDIVVIRDGHRVRLEDYYMVPLEYTEDGETVTLYGIKFGDYDTGFWAHIKYPWYSTLDFVRLVKESLVSLFTGGAAVKDLSGVVGIVDVMADVGRQSGTFGEALRNIGYITALIAVNLAVLNLLPLPALDGGRVFFLLVNLIVEKLFHRRVDPKYEGYIHTAGLVLLLGLMVFVLYNDIVRIFAG